MNYNQTLEFLFQSLPAFETKGATAYKPGLERIAAFCRHLGNPQRNFFTIHVAGTNGKGSVSHIIASVLQQAGYRTGLFTSPHLQDFRERIRVDGEMIPKQKVVNFVDKHHDKMVELDLSFFEMTTAMAFDYFAQSKVEVAVIETGLGGRLDATNVIVPILSIITNIGLEHTALLGDALQKSPPRRPASSRRAFRWSSARATCATTASSSRPPRPTSRRSSMPSRSSRAKSTASRARASSSACAARATDMSSTSNWTCRATIRCTTSSRPRPPWTSCTRRRRSPISRRAYIEGMRCAAANTSLMGRWQTLGREPLTVCDTGHNAHGIAYVAEQLKSTPHRELYCVMGFVRDKDLAHILPLLPRNAHYIFTQAHSDRALPADELTAKAAIYGLQGETVGDVKAAVAQAPGAGRSRGHDLHRRQHLRRGRGFVGRSDAIPKQKESVPVRPTDSSYLALQAAPGQVRPPGTTRHSRGRSLRQVASAGPRYHQGTGQEAQTQDRKPGMRLSARHPPSGTEASVPQPSAARRPTRRTPPHSGSPPIRPSDLPTL